MGLYPVDTDSSDDDLFTGNVWWEDPGGTAGKGGKDNPAFEGKEAEGGESTKEEEPSAGKEPAA